jgi:hypothetical protein
MSSNPKITEQSWIKLSVSMAASSCLHELYLDYNNIGDLAASSVLVGLASHIEPLLRGHLPYKDIFLCLKGDLLIQV